MAMKVKIFTENSDIVLQKSINKWLEDAGPIVVYHILQSESSSENLLWSLTISIFYMESQS